MHRNIESVIKRKDFNCNFNSVSGSAQAKYREINNRRHRRYVKCRMDLTNENKTIAEIMTAWLNDRKNRIKLSTFQKYNSVISNHISNSIGRTTIDQLSSSAISRFTDELVAKGLSYKTINLILIVLNMGLEFAKEQYEIFVPVIHLLKTKKSVMRVLSEADQHILVHYLLEQSDIFSFGILVALYTGIRIGELCALEWKDITENTIRIKQTMQRLKNDFGKTEIKIMPPKSESSNRIIPIPASLAPLFEQHRRSSGYVLTQENQRFTEPRLLQIKFKKCLKECGIEEANFHTLRHTFATRCVESGVDIKTLSEILGHADVKTTLNKYIHSSFEQKQRSIDKLTIAF